MADGGNMTGRMLRAVRTQRGLTLRAAAKRIGVSFVFLGEIERGLKRVSFERERKFCKVLGIPQLTLLAAMAQDAGFG